jgi:DUF4097 and DUF4098 domain-containing protein YvlB
MKAIKWIIVTCLIIGVILFGIAFASGATFDDFWGMFDDSDKYSEVKTYHYDEAADQIEISVEDRFIEFIYSDVEFISVEYREHERDTWTFDLVDSKVTINQKKTYQWRLINFSFAPDSYKAMKVYLPEGSEYSFDVSTNVGSITLDFDTNVNVTSLKLDSNTGSIKLKNLTVSDVFEISNDTGSIQMNQITGDDLKVSLATGNLEINTFGFNSMDIDSSTGHLNLTNGAVSTSIKADLSTGSIEFNDVSAASYDLSTATGSIEISTDQVDQMYFDLNTSVGSITVKGINRGNTYITDSSDTHTVYVKIRTSTGSINIHS